MNPLLSAISRYWRRPGRVSSNRTSRRQTQKPRLYLECLEDRIVPSYFSIADVAVREGPTSAGILDPSGAASVGINGIRDMTFDNGPSDAHYGDLFVTGYLSNSVARFDWASQTYQPFVAPGSGGLQQPRGIAFGPDGNLYVTEQSKDVSQQSQDMVFRFNGSTGAPLPAPGQSGAVFIPADSGGLSKACDLTFGADGNLYVISGNTNQILEYQGPAGSSPGAFMKVFVSITNGSGPNNLAFGPDGNLYVGLADGAIPGYTPPFPASYGSINRYDGTTGAPIGNGVFVTYASGGLAQPRQFVFDSQGTNLYVTSSQNATGGPMGQVLRYQGPNGQNPGAFVEAYITGGQAGVSIPIGLASDAAGNLYVSDRDTANVTRFAPSSQASFTVTLDSPSASPVSVNYATADGTAVAGTDYTQTSGILIFPAGVTSETISVPIITVATGGPTKAFTMNLSGASGATINRAQGNGSILNRQTKFFVVDSGSVVKTYEYGSGGTSEEITAPYYTNDTSPRGVAANAAGTTEWVVDANKSVYVYNNHGVLQGSWSAGGLSSSAQLTGIATNGTDIWLVDSSSAKVYKFTGAASRLSGSQSAASSFKLNRSNTNPQDIVTDGTSFWVVDGTALRVFKYTLSGSLLGSWSIDPANTHPTGITINPNNVSDIWIVDNGTDKVYQYIGAASRTSGSQNAAATFALNPYDTNPQGIADPPTADMPVTPAAVNDTRNGEGTTAASSTSDPSNGVPSRGKPTSAADQLFANLAGILSDVRDDYPSELSAVATMWQSADTLALQRLDALRSMEAGAMGMSRDTRMSDPLLAVSRS